LSGARERMMTTRDLFIRFLLTWTIYLIEIGPLVWESGGLVFNCINFTRV
jgi:hypothetical protein